MARPVAGLPLFCCWGWCDTLVSAATDSQRTAVGYAALGDRSPHGGVPPCVIIDISLACVPVAPAPQVLHFPLNESPTLPWEQSSVMAPVSSLLGSLSVTSLLLRTSQLKLIAFACSLIWMVGVLGCALWVGHSFSRESFKYLWPISVRGVVCTVHG